MPPTAGEKRSAACHAESAKSKLNAEARDHVCTNVDGVTEVSSENQSLHVTMQPGLSDKESSVTLYHEVLEAMTVAVSDPPESVIDFNEGDFEREGYEAHDKFGPVSPANLNRMLQFYGFREH